MNAHKTVSSMAPKIDPKWCEVGRIRPITTSFLDDYCDTIIWPN